MMDMPMYKIHAIVEEEVGQKDDFDRICAAVFQGVPYYSMDAPFLY